MAEPALEPGLTRRAWLKVGALAGGGLVLSLALPSLALSADASPPIPADPPEPVAPNAWIRIHGDGRIQLLLARSEMGQGVSTALPMLLAEELEVGLDQIEVEPAPVDGPYANTLLGEQATGESTSVRDAWMTLREAGAVARMLMIAAAAESWGVEEGQCRAERGRVWHADGVLSLAYGELAAQASRRPIPSRVDLKEKASWRLIGTVQRRLDTPLKVSGQAIFGLDVRLPGMLYATIARCPVLGSRVSAWRASGARASAGVVEILAVRQGVAVVADSTWAALRGRERLVVECRPESDPSLGSERLRARLRLGLSGRAAVARREGDVSRALAAAARDIEAVYELPYQAHACMEPMNCTADVRADGCDIHVPTQSQAGVLETARRLTGLPRERIGVHTTLLGGGHGRRREQDFVADAVELSLRLGRPVQVIWTREDDLRHDYYRPMILHRLRGGLDADGNLVAWFHRVVGPSILSRRQPERVRDGIDPVMIAGAVDIPYRIPHARVELRRADSPVPVGLWRGEGYSHNSFAVECFLDELARAAGRDPWAMRRGLLAASPRHLRLLDRIAEVAPWHEAPPPGRGRGMALVEAFGSLIAAVAEVSVEAGRVAVHRVICVVDCGQTVNPDMVRAQVEGGIAHGLTATLKGAITLAEGRVEQSGFGDYPLLRFDEMPEVEVRILDSDAPPGGVSGLATPVIAPAVANALHGLMGTPVRSLPIRLA